MLLIGETGVGKSTWINACANYGTFSSLDDALQAGGLFPIPCTFETSDPETNETIHISSDGNVIPATSHAAEVGESVTQMPGVYSFKYENTQINLIDTPGINATQDTSGHDKDKEHVNNILRLLSMYNEIQAICIVVKASENRLSNALQYTLTELLKHLDKDACNNVIFMFTYAASTNFKPVKIQTILQKFLNDKEVRIPLPKSTVYCFENNTMDYLAECKTKIPQNEHDKTVAHMNWEKSVNSTMAMLDYVRSLKSHSLAKIKKIHHAVHAIDLVSELVLEILMCISKDEDDLEQKKKEAATVQKQIAENFALVSTNAVQKLLLVTETKVVRTPLGYTNVVCESPRCGILHDGKVVYPQVCCANCWSNWISMYFCTKMNWSAVCKICGCEKNKHKWRSTLTELVTETMEKVEESRMEESVIQQTVDSGDALKTIDMINNSVSASEQRLEKCKSESEIMLRTCAQLNTFVHQNALMEHGDKLSISLQDRIEIHEKAKSTAKELGVLIQIQCQYQTLLDEEKNNSYHADDVDELIQQIYELPMKGNDVKKAMEVEEEARRAVVEMGRKSKPIRLSWLREQAGKVVSIVCPIEKL